ncbi:hypothetical protein PsYK624_106920 [Phanerochaete sordida]|uniref:Uncharacterized protein n=1 Tax=Phanerochaete sordida TaxID=48140 RepID=A0A9P3GF31_9APHY|nr:hypothetical protein PsYK624_106920 [Phanerochaete sordida]
MLLALNVAQMATFRVEAAPVSILVSSLPSVLISRFMLNLRHASRPPSDRTTAASLTEMSFPDFRAPSTFTGNIGEPLDYGEEDSVTFAPWDGDDLGDEQRLDGESANDTNASPVESSVAC